MMNFEIKAMEVFAIAEDQDDGSFFIKKSIKDGSLAIFDELSDANQQQPSISSANMRQCSIQTCHLLTEKSFNSTKEHIADISKENEQLRDFVKSISCANPVAKIGVKGKDGYEEHLPSSWSDRAKQLLIELEKGDE